jgi:hypothetical protein
MHLYSKYLRNSPVKTAATAIVSVIYSSPMKVKEVTCGSAGSTYRNVAMIRMRPNLIQDVILLRQNQ